MALTRRKLLTYAAGAMLASVLPALASETHLLSGRAFGTSWQVRLCGKADPEALARELAGMLARIDLAMSPFRPDSTITRFNTAPAGRHDVGPDFATVTSEALRIAALTSGAFDPSVGPAVSRFGFGPIHGERAGGVSGFAVDGLALSKSRDQLTLDLCGIAKGYALDLMADLVVAAGADDFVAELGGEVLAQGRDIEAKPWRIGISDPLVGGIHAIVDARGLALATSGDAINVYTVGGRRYSHIIDPGTDEPLVSEVASVSVFAARAMTADALATALMVMGPDKGLAFAEAHDIPVLYLLRTPTGLREISSRAFGPHRMS